MGKHVKEPLGIDVEPQLGNPSFHIWSPTSPEGDEPTILGTIHAYKSQFPVPSSREQVEATAHRLVDCYNACTGVEHPSEIGKCLIKMNDFVESFRNEMENDEEINGSDAVEWLTEFWRELQEVLSRVGRIDFEAVREGHGRA